MKELKKQGRPHNPHPFEGVQVEKVMIACDNILSLSGQGARQYSKIVGIAQLCRDNSRVRYQQSGVLDQGDKVVDVLRRKVVTIFQMWTGEGFFQFEEERKTGHEIEMPHPPGLQNLCRSSVRRDQSADENVGVENRPRHSDAYGSERKCPGQGSRLEWSPDRPAERT